MGTSLYLSLVLPLAAVILASPLKKSSLDASAPSINLLPFRDNDDSVGPLVRRDRGSHAKHSPNRSASKIKISHIVNKIIAAPQQAYKEHITDNKWRQILRKGGIKTGGRRKYTPSNPLHVSAMRQVLRDTSLYPSLHSKTARLKTSTARLPSPPTDPIPNPYIYNHQKYAPSAPPMPSDPPLPAFDASKLDKPFYRRASTPPKHNPYEQYSIPTSTPPRPPVKELKDNLKLFGGNVVQQGMKVYQKELKNKSPHEVWTRGKHLLNKGAGMIEKKMEKEFNKKYKTGQSSQQTHTTTTTDHHLPHAQPAQYAPSAPPLPAESAKESPYSRRARPERK